MPIISRTDKHTDARPKQKHQTPIRITSAAVNTTVLTLVFDQPVVLKVPLVPQITTDVPGATPESATATAIDTIEVTFSATIAAATEINIPYLDPAIRSKVGGFIADSTFPVA